MYIYINCYNSLRFFPGFSKTLRKGHNFCQFKDHKSRRRYEIKTNDPIFFIYFSSLTFSEPHFSIWKLSKYIFIRSPFGLLWAGKYLNFGGASCVRLGFFPAHFRKHNYWGKKKKKTDITFPFDLRINSKMFKVIS